MLTSIFSACSQASCLSILVERLWRHCSLEAERCWIMSQRNHEFDHVCRVELRDFHRSRFLSTAFALLLWNMDCINSFLFFCWDKSESKITFQHHCLWNLLKLSQASGFVSPSASRRSELTHLTTQLVWLRRTLQPVASMAERRSDSCRPEVSTLATAS